MKDPQNLCLELVYAETEDEIINILKQHGLWDDDNAWKAYGGSENNWGQIGNQQARAEAALTELLTNAADALLMRECKLKGIDPEDKEHVPATIEDAAKEFFGIGSLNGMSSRQRTELAEKSCGIVASGEKKKINLSVFDFGEGQSPEKFEDTLLSLSKSNKNKIPFVQGKYNQGSTGTIRFCGKHGFKLIISRKNPELARGKPNEWGFSLTRRVIPSEENRNKSSVVKYLAPEGRILRFEADSLPLLPKKYPEAYGSPMGSGTYIKLYNYGLKAGQKTNIQFDLSIALSSLLIRPVFPVRMYERRSGYRSHSPETTMNGLNVRLKDRNSDILEEGFPISTSFSCRGVGQLSCTIFALKKKAEKNHKFSAEDGIIFEINGQSHATLPRRFFNSKDVNLGYLKNSIVVFVNCSDLDVAVLDELFFGSRDRMKNCEEQAALEKELKRILREHQLLRELNTQRRSEQIKEKGADNKISEALYKKMQRLSVKLNELLISGNRLGNPFDNRSGEEKAKAHFTPSFFPTYFDLDKPQELRLVQVGTQMRLKFRTDAPNDYLHRDKSQGQFTVRLADEELLWQWRIDPNNGIWHFNATVPHDMKLGSESALMFTLDGVHQQEKYTIHVPIKYVAYEQKTSGNRSNQDRERNDGEMPGQNAGNQGSLPNIIDVPKDEWGNHGFDKSSAMKIVSNGQTSYDFFVNIENYHLLHYLKNNGAADTNLVKFQYKYALYFFSMALIVKDNKEHTGNSNGVDEADEVETIEDKVYNMTSAISPVLLPLFEGLAQIEEADFSE